MNEENEAEGASAKRVPLTEAELADLEILAGDHYWTDGDREDLRLALPSLISEVRRLREKESRTERAAMEVHGMSECRYMEPLWENYTGLPCHECIEAARRLAIKAGSLEDLT